MTTPRDHIRQCLEVIGDNATYLLSQLKEIELAAYAQSHSNDEDRIQTSTQHDLSSVGQPRARALWARLARDCRHCANTLDGLRYGTERLWAEGKLVDKRGSLIRNRDFRESLDAQRRRDERGEFTPIRIEDQPRFPYRGRN